MILFTMCSMTITGKEWLPARVTNYCASGNAPLTCPSRLCKPLTKRVMLGYARNKFSNTRGPSGGWHGQTRSSVRYSLLAATTNKFAFGKRRNPRRSQKQHLSNKRKVLQTLERDSMYAGLPSSTNTSKILSLHLSSLRSLWLLAAHKEKSKSTQC